MIRMLFRNGVVHGGQPGGGASALGGQGWDEIAPGVEPPRLLRTVSAGRAIHRSHQQDEKPDGKQDWA